LGVVAATAHASRGRGVPLESSRAIMDALARDARVAEDWRARIRLAVDAGYRARSEQDAEVTVASLCREGRL
jgi:hypothetical protein